MNEVEKDYESLSDIQIEEMIKNLRSLQNKREASYIQIMLDRNGAALEAYLKEHDFKLSPGMLDNLNLDNFAHKDIPFYEAVKKSIHWEKFKTTSYIKSLCFSALKDKELIDYFLLNDKDNISEYIINSTKVDKYPLETIKKLYSSNIFDLNNSKVRAYFVVSPNESIVMYGLENNLLNLEKNELKMLFINKCTEYDPMNLEAIKKKIGIRFVCELNTILNNLGAAYPIEQDKVDESYYNLTLANDMNFEYIINNSTITTRDIEKILKNLEEAFPLRQSKVKLLSQAVAHNESLTNAFINFRKKITNDIFINTFDNAALYLKLHKDLDDKKVATKLKI